MGKIHLIAVGVLEGQEEPDRNIPWMGKKDRIYPAITEKLSGHL